MTEREIEISTVEKVLDIIRDLQLKSEFPTPEDWANYFKSQHLIQIIKDAFGMGMEH